MWGMQCRVLGRQGVVDKEDRPRERQDQGNEVRESATGRVFLKAEMEPQSRQPQRGTEGVRNPELKPGLYDKLTAEPAHRCE